MRDEQDRQTPDLITGGLRIGYARVSTVDQNLDMQLDALRGAGCNDIYADKISGSTKDRPELSNALRALRPGDTLVVWRLDRLGRSLKHLVELITELDQSGIQLESLTESIDTRTPSGRLMAHLFGVLAEFDLNLIRERTREGLKAARARGRNGGRRKSFTDKNIADIESMLIHSDMQVSDIAKLHNVSRTTIYNNIDMDKVRTKRAEIELSRQSK